METKIKSGKVANIKLKNKLRKNKHKLGPIIEEKDDTEAELKILTELNENVKKLTFPNSERVDHMDFEELQMLLRVKYFLDHLILIKKGFY